MDGGYTRVTNKQLIVRFGVQTKASPSAGEAQLRLALVEHWRDGGDPRMHGLSVREAPFGVAIAGTEETRVRELGWVVHEI